jgi:hypothetical protein
MIIIDSRNILDHKPQLTKPKTSDKFQLDINLNNGQRFYNVSIGRKWVYFRPVFTVGVIKKSIKEGKKILNAKYWRAAQTDAFYNNCTGSNRRKSLPKRWMAQY